MFFVLFNVFEERRKRERQFHKCRQHKRFLIVKIESMHALHKV